MCYFDQGRWECGDFKWGNFKRHCQSEYRMGETCGMKLIWETRALDGNCPYCDKLERKKRRFEKARTDYMRWREDPSRKASAEKALEDCKALQQEITTLQNELTSRRQNVGNPRRQNRHAAHHAS
jgi:hypothetical protein